MLPETVRAYAEKRNVSVAVLFQFNFASQTKRYWNGLGPLTAGAETWEGSGDVLSVSGIEQPVALSAPVATFKLSGAKDDLMNYAANSESEVTGHTCALYLQFLERARVALDDPIPIWAGIMDVMSFNTSVRDRGISLTAETLFVGRTRATYGYMTDTDQQARWPGDVGFEFMASLINKTTSWLRG